MLIDLAAGCALGDLVGFHCYLLAKGRSTYEHILLKRKEREQKYKADELPGMKPEEEQCKDAKEMKVHRQSSSETEMYFGGRQHDKKLSDLKGIETTKTTSAKMGKKKLTISKEKAIGLSSDNKDYTDTNIDAPGLEPDDPSYDYKENVFSKRTNLQAEFEASSPTTPQNHHQIELAHSSSSLQIARLGGKTPVQEVTRDHMQIRHTTDS